jgi:hypothetical protein
VMQSRHTIEVTVTFPYRALKDLSRHACMPFHLIFDHRLQMSCEHVHTYTLVDIPDKRSACMHD